MKSYKIRENEITLFFYPKEEDDKSENGFPILSMPELSIFNVRTLRNNSSIILKLLDFDKNSNCIYLLFDYIMAGKSESLVYKWKPTIPVLCILPNKYGYEEDEHKRYVSVYVGKKAQNKSDIAVCGLSVKLHN